MQGFTGAGELVTAHIYGFRAWRVTAQGLLRPWTFSDGMVYRSADNVASCDRHYTWDLASGDVNGNPRKHEPRIPDPLCACGIWAYWSMPPSLPRVQVIGVIAASGRVLLGPKGFRAERADIAALYVPIWRWQRRRMLRANYSEVPIYASRRRMARRHEPQIENLVPDALPNVVPLSFLSYITMLLLAINWHLILAWCGIHVRMAPAIGFTTALFTGGIVGVMAFQRAVGRTTLPMRFHRWYRRRKRRWADARDTTAGSAS